MQAAYFAPRGRRRLLHLGSHIALRYLSADDRLVGFVGDAGAGKSLLIRGMFPGLELTNDDDGINLRPLPLINDHQNGSFRCRTYHVDARFETAFAQPYQLAEAAKQAILKGRRVIIEHFDILYPLININAEVLIGVGEEVIVTRPGVFGPFPEDLKKIVFPSLKFRKMAHSAEDLTAMVLSEMGYNQPEVHGDIRHGFILEFHEKPEIDLDLVEKRVLEYIQADEPICFYDEEHIRVGERIHPCTGPRLHSSRTGDIHGFSLVKEFIWDPIEKLYTLAGLVGRDEKYPASEISPFDFGVKRE